MQKNLSKSPLPPAVEIFPILIFDLKQTCKKVPAENCKIQNFPATCFVYKSKKKFDKAFEIIKDVKILSFEENLGELLVKIWFVRQLLTKYFGKSKRIKQNWARQENFDIRFCVSFVRYCQKFNFQKEDWTLPVSPSNFKVPFLFPNFLRS